jgi:hypothetical protein
MPKLLTQGVSLEPKPGRQLIGIVAGFKLERWPVIDRNAGRLKLGIRNWRADRQRKQQTTGRGMFVPLSSAQAKHSSSIGVKTMPSLAASARSYGEDAMLTDLLPPVRSWRVRSLRSPYPTLPGAS